MLISWNNKLINNASFVDPQNCLIGKGFSFCKLWLLLWWLSFCSTRKCKNTSLIISLFKYARCCNCINASKHNYWRWWYSLHSDKCWNLCKSHKLYWVNAILWLSSTPKEETVSTLLQIWCVCHTIMPSHRFSSWSDFRSNKLRMWCSPKTCSVMNWCEHHHQFPCSNSWTHPPSASSTI